jgi:hypothetical protein
MSDESGDGAAYLSALKQSVSPRRGETGPFGESSIGAEKRRSPRYRCQGSAHLRELSSGISTWATFTDISLHGCYVEAAATFLTGAALALKIELNKFKVEANGEVRVAYLNLGMGIFFTSMSTENRERLRELLRSLSRPSAIVESRTVRRSSEIFPPGGSSPVTNASVTVQAIMRFFDERQILTRDEFVRILRKSEMAER